MSDRNPSRLPPVLPAKTPAKQNFPQLPPLPTETRDPAPPQTDSIPSTISTAIDCKIPTNGPSYAKSARMYRIRDKVAHEILSTEMSYVESLNVMCDIWLKGLQSSDTITDQQTQSLFSNIEVIRNCNQEFCLFLSERLAKWEESTTLADLFVRFAPFFRMYTTYVLNHDRAGELLNELNKNSRFQRVCEAIGKEAKVRGLELSSYLIMPIQRIPRYKLLLTELKKNTPLRHGDHQHLDAALDIIGKVAKDVNDAVKLHENRTTMVNIQKQFTNDVDLVVPFRSFVRKGPLVKKCRSSDIEYEFMLFNDLLLYASVTVAKSYRLHRKLPITRSFQINSLEDTKTDRNRFEIKTPDKSFIVLVATPELKEEWLADLYKCINQQKMSINNDHLGGDDNGVAPVWQGDSSSTCCPCCGIQFSFLKRRHHCRKCGSLVCNDCSKERIPDAKNVPQRICNTCVRKFRPESRSEGPEDTSFSLGGESSFSVPPSPMAPEHSRMDSVSVIESTIALNGITEEKYEDEENAEDDVLCPREKKGRDKDLTFPVYVTTQHFEPNHGFYLRYAQNSKIRTYVIDAANNLGLGKLESEQFHELGVFSLSHVSLLPNQPSLRDHSYIITSSSTVEDFGNCDYIHDELLLNYEKDHVIVISDSEWDKADESNPWVTVFNATTRMEGCIPMYIRNKVKYSLEAFCSTSFAVSPSASATRPIPVVPSKPTNSLYSNSTPEPQAMPRHSFQAPEGNPPPPSKPLSIPAVPKKPTSSLYSTQDTAAQTPQYKVGGKAEGTGHCGMASCGCDKFLPNQFRNTICLHCRHNISYHTV